MAHTLRVRDLMTSDVITLSPKATLADAARILSDDQVSGAPVVDQGRILGVLSATDLVRAQAGGRSADLTVQDAMTYVIWAVRPGDAAILAVRLMLNERIHRALVVDDGGRLLGVVTPLDVLRGLAEGGHLEESDDACFDQRHGDPATGTGYVDLRDLPPTGTMG
jgi:CBS domain-containing protein